MFVISTFANHVAGALVHADDRQLRAAVFYDPQHDTVIGGAELKEREQAVNRRLPLKEQPTGEFKLVTMLADAGGNIATIVATATATSEKAAGNK